jgi:arabinogalactan oligomer / maltooligosaccharide transport system permease protein
MMVVLLGGLQSIPKELYESAWVDGANRLRQLFSITLPLLKPVALTATLLGAIWTFNMFNVIYLLQGSSRQVEILATYAYKRAFEDWQFGIATAYGVIILIILLIFSSFYIRLLKGTGELN